MNWQLPEEGMQEGRKQERKEGMSLEGRIIERIIELVHVKYNLLEFHKLLNLILIIFKEWNILYSFKRILLNQIIIL